MLTEKDYCDYDTCAALMEIGFNISDRCVPDYLEGKRIHIWDAQKWLRERYNLHITIYSQSQESWQYRITKPHQKLEDGLHGEDFSSYEEALSEGIKNTINFLKENNELV